MTSVYALLVGIDAYQTVDPLAGCRADVAAARDLLRARVDADRLHLLELYDANATRAGIVDGLRGHLGRAGRDDVALFWFAGHGSQAPVPPHLWAWEPTGLMQTLVCVDSRANCVPDLYDKELNVLLRGVAASGAHVVAVLDCCHAGGVVRGEVPEPQARVRAAPPPAEVPRAAALLADDDPAGDFVALCACRSFELAQELPVDGTVRGVFSWALLRAMARLGPQATGRELLVGASCAVEDVVAHQVPVLFAQTPGLGDRPLLGGPAGPAGPGVVMRHLRGVWEIDAGACHGLPATAGEPVRVGVAGEPVVREARVTSVRTERSIVEPIGWRPDEEKQYPVVLTGLPLPVSTVAVDGEPATARALAAAVDRSPHLRRLSSGIPELRAVAGASGRIRLLGTDCTPVAPDLPGGPAAASQVVQTLEHIARWRQVKALDNPLSTLAAQVSVEIVEALPGERRAPLDRPAVRPGSDGLIRLAYRRAGAGWVPPTIFVRLRNNAARPLHFVLLDLTDRYRIWPGLFPGERVGAGLVGAALDGRPVQMSLPPGVPAAPGASVRDWFKLFVAEEQFSSRPFELPRLGEPWTPGTRNGLRGILERLGRQATHRDADTAPGDDVYDWAGSTVAICTEVPAP